MSNQNIDFGLKFQLGQIRKKSNLRKMKRRRKPLTQATISSTTTQSTPPSKVWFTSSSHTRRTSEDSFGLWLFFWCSFLVSTGALRHTPIGKQILFWPRLLRQPTQSNRYSLPKKQLAFPWWIGYCHILYLDQAASTAIHFCKLGFLLLFLY